MGSGKGGGGGGGGNQTVTTTNTPWSGAEPYINEQLQAAQDIFKNQPPSQYPGLTVAQRSFPTMLAEELTLGRALAGSGITDSARQQYQQTVDGGYLDPTQNPGFQAGTQAVADRYREAVAPQTDAAFSRSGAFGGSAHQNQMGINQRELSRGLNDVSANIYQDERNKQYGAMLGAPQFAMSDYNEIAPIAAVGDQRDGYNQALINDAVDKYGFDANASRQNLGDYINFVSGAAGGTGTTTQTQPVNQNSTAGVLGGALGGAQLAGSFGAGSTLPWHAGTLMGPAGIAAGAIGGGLLGLK